MAVSLLGCGKPSRGTGLAVSVLFGINELRNQLSHLVGPTFPAFKAHF